MSEPSTQRPVFRIEGPVIGVIAAIAIIGLVILGSNMPSTVLLVAYVSVVVLALLFASTVRGRNMILKGPLPGVGG